MSGDRLALAIELWTHQAATLRDLALQAATTTPRTAAERRLIAQLVDGQATVAKSSLSLLTGIRDQISELPPKVGDAIGDLCGESAIMAWNILSRCAENKIDREEAYLEAFSECQKLASTLKEQLQRAAGRAMRTADQLVLAESERRERLRESVIQLTADRIDSDSDSPDSALLKEAQQNFEQAAEALTKLTQDIDQLERPGQTLTHLIVNAGLVQVTPILDRAIDGDFKAIARRFENYRSLAELGAGLLGVGVEISKAPAGLGSFVALVTGIIIRRWSEPIIGRRREAMERTRRKMAVHMLSIFLLPFTACMTASFHVLEAKDRVSLTQIAAEGNVSSA